ncbi:hypothetical protein KFK09_024342 [Dendrobium nobile]|uniref:WW domain-containing protein n=1 Tax=Dendrobium nobile TaxID=94219 RepID=A0A8T3ADR1_DENNO|nr:hypothetical protein KFK09_024342 [Dendrobium nobile]
MVKKLLLKAKTELQVVEEKKRNTTRSNTDQRLFPLRNIMDHPNLSLGPSMSQADSNNSSSCKSEENNSRKRKLASWEEPSTQTGIDFHINDPLPMGWEQCLNLQSGRIYYLNRKTLTKSWVRPKEQNLDLELNISTPSTSTSFRKRICQNLEEEVKKPSSSSNGSSSMVAIVCFNCHLLVMLYRSSPSCPNCKYMHSLPQKMETVKSFETLSLLH